MTEAITEAEFSRQRETYRRNMREYALAVRRDIDAIVVAVETGQDMDDAAVAMYRRGSQTLESALTPYARTRSPAAHGVDGAS